MSAACCGRRSCCRRARTTRRAGSTWTSAARDRGRRDPRRRGDAARRRPAVRHRRRVPPRLLAHGLHLPARRHQQGAGHAERSSSATPTATIEFTPAALHIDGRIGVSKTIFGEDFAFLRSIAGGRHAEADDPVAEHGPLPRRPGGDRRVGLPGPRRVLGRPHRAPTPRRSPRVGELGCTYLQFDDTSLAYLNDPNQREMIAQQGEDAEHLHEAYIRHINEALADRPEGMAVTTHMCRGNFRSSWVAEGGYDFVAEALFNELAVDGFFMEWDDERSGGFEPLRFVPPGQARRARARDDQDGRAREQGRAQAPDRGGVAVRRRRPALPVAPVRLLLHGRGQRPHAASSRPTSCA